MRNITRDVSYSHCCSAVLKEKAGLVQNETTASFDWGAVLKKCGFTSLYFSIGGGRSKGTAWAKWSTSKYLFDMKSLLHISGQKNMVSSSSMFFLISFRGRQDHKDLLVM